MDGTEILPFAGSHFRTGLTRAWRVVVHEKDGDHVCLLGEESTEFVEPQIPVYCFILVDLWWSGQLQGSFFCDWDGSGGIWSVGEGGILSFKVFLELERRVELQETSRISMGQMMAQTECLPETEVPVGDQLPCLLPLCPALSSWRSLGQPSGRPRIGVHFRCLRFPGSEVRTGLRESVEVKEDAESSKAIRLTARELPQS